MRTASLTAAILLGAAFGRVACSAGPDHGSADCRVAVDVGHTLAQPGATSARGVGEFSFNREMARQLLEELRGRGLKEAFIINEEGADISLAGRTEAADQRRADLLISIHHDSVQPRYLSTWTYSGEERPYSDRFRGFSLFYSEQSGQPEASLDFARRIGSLLRAAGLAPTLHHAEAIEGENRRLVDAERGIHRFDELVVLRTAKMPAVLLECGVIVNRDEEALLGDPSYRRKLAAAVAGAIEETCRVLGSTPSRR
jgi:N-acetylmuramoyl-L-alanine amidase